MELALRDVIGAALKVESAPLQILCANIHFRDKIHILRALVDVSYFSDDEKRYAKTKLRKLGNHAGRRNMLAHEPFLADPKSKGVQFLTVKAKGEYSTPTIVWSSHQFNQEGRALRSYTLFLECLEKLFKEKPLTYRNYVEALLPYLQGTGQLDVDATVLPSRHTTEPVPDNSLSQHFQDDPDSDPTNSEKNAQTPDKPQE